MKTGIELIAEERQRQIKVKGWTKEHDAEHKNGELAKAAICYADPNVYYHQENRIIRYRIPNKFWPKQWDIHWFKPTDRIQDLIKAGALIAAEIDRLQAQKEEEPVSDECIYNRTLEERQRSCKFCSAACQVRIKEEPVSEDLDKAAEKAAVEAFFVSPQWTAVGKELFKAGAMWQKRKDEYITEDLESYRKDDSN